MPSFNPIPQPTSNRLISGMKDKTRNQYWNVSVPAWTIGEQVYTNEVRSNNGRWYVAKSSGTCGAFAPNVVLPKASSPQDQWNDGAVDGTGASGGVVWYYYGKEIATPYDDGTVESITVAFSASHDADVTQVFTPVSGSRGTPTSYVKQSDVNSTKLWVPSGGGASQSIAAWVGWGLNTNAPAMMATISSGGSNCISFLNGVKDSGLFLNVNADLFFEILTDSNKIEINTSKYASGIAGTLAKVFVDDVPVSPSTNFASTALTGGMANGDLSTLVTITGARKIRRIRFHGWSGIRTIRIVPNSKLYPFLDRSKLKILAIGDSYIAGSGQFGILGIVGLIQQRLDAEINNISIGGTKVEAATGSGDSFINRMVSNYAGDVPNALYTLNHVNNRYDIVLLFCTGNDTAASSTLTTSYLTLLNNIRTQQPSAKIIVVGCTWATANNATINTKAASAVYQFQDGNTYWVDTANAVYEGGWITGTGYSGSYSVTGNSSLLISTDGVHPNNYGAEVISEKVIQAIRSIINT